MGGIVAEYGQPPRVVRSRLFERLATVAPVLEAHQTQIGRGEYIVDAIVARAADVWLLRTRMNTLDVSHIVPDPSLLAFLVPVAWRGDYRFNGVSASASTIYVSSGPDGYSTRSSKRDYFNIGVNRKRFIDSLAALEAVHPEEIQLHDGALELLPASVLRLRRILNHHLKVLTTGPGCDMSQQASIAEAITNVMLEAYMAGVPVSKDRAPRVKSREQIVRIAEEHFMEAADTQISLPELCHVTGVRRTLLYEAFNSLYGTSPLSYFRKRRLMRARTALMIARPESTQVKEIALSLGLTHLGRFSTEYRSLFGEPPSVTLNSRLEGRA